MPEAPILACIILAALVIILAVMLIVLTLRNKKLSRAMNLRLKELEEVRGRIAMLQHSLSNLRRGGEEVSFTAAAEEAPSGNIPEPEPEAPSPEPEILPEETTVTEEEHDTRAVEQQVDEAPEQEPLPRSVRSRRPDHIKAIRDRELFNMMDRMIRDEKLYLDNGLRREHITSRLGIDKNRLVRIISDNGASDSFTSYINGLRLSHASLLMEEHPEYKMDKIASESGFGNVRNLQRILKASYGMTPAEFRSTNCGQNSAVPTKTAQ